MLKTMRLSLKLLRREAHAGEWLILFLALVFSVTVVTTLDFYTSRIKASITSQSNRILGGDFAIVSSRAIPTEWENEAERLHLKHAQVWSYPSVIKAGDQFQLVTIQAISDNYPILTTQLNKPLLGTIWVEPRILPLLNLTLDAQVNIGDKTLIVAKVLTPDIDQLTTGLTIAPRVLMRLKDVPQTHTVLPGSRVEFRLLIAGDPQMLGQFKHWVESKLTTGQRIITIKDQQAFINNLINRTENYLQLVMLICIVMSCIAIILSVYQYLRRHYTTVALWRCLGISQGQLISIMLTQILFIALSAGIVGTLFGFALQTYFNSLLANVIPLSLTQTTYVPAIKGLVTSLLILLAFAYPLLSVLPKTSPLYLWRNEAASTTFNSFYYILTIISVLSLLLFWVINVSLLTLFFIDMILFSIALMYGLSIGLMALTQQLLPYTNGAIKRGLSHLIQHPDTSNLQFSALTLILTCLLLLGFIRTSLVQHWHTTLPANTPNYFIFNMAPDDLTPITSFLRSEEITVTAVYPMARGRLTLLNDHPIIAAVPASARGHNTLHRELNLSWMLTYPSDNVIIDGDKWSATTKGKPYASVEESMAKQLQLKIGDKLTFQLGDKKVNAYIANIRKVDWTSFHPNFYVIFPPSFIDTIDTTYITSIYLPPSKAIILNQLTNQYPNITIIDVASIIQQIQSLIAKGSSAIQYLFLLALGSAILILTITIQTSMDERRQTWKILRMLGASKRYLINSAVAEFSYLAILIVCTSFVLSQGLAFILERNLFG